MINKLKNLLNKIEIFFEKLIQKENKKVNLKKELFSDYIRLYRMQENAKKQKKNSIIKEENDSLTYLTIFFLDFKNTKFYKKQYLKIRTSFLYRYYETIQEFWFEFKFRKYILKFYNTYVVSKERYVNNYFDENQELFVNSCSILLKKRNFEQVSCFNMLKNYSEDNLPNLNYAEIRYLFFEIKHNLYVNNIIFKNYLEKKEKNIKIYRRNETFLEEQEKLKIWLENWLKVHSKDLPNLEHEKKQLALKKEELIKSLAKVNELEKINQKAINEVNEIITPNIRHLKKCIYDLKETKIRNEFIIRQNVKFSFIISTILNENFYFKEYLKMAIHNIVHSNYKEDDYFYEENLDIYIENLRDMDYQFYDIENFYFGTNYELKFDHNEEDFGYTIDGIKKEFYNRRIYFSEKEDRNNWIKLMLYIEKIEKEKNE